MHTELLHWSAAQMYEVNYSILPPAGRPCCCSTPFQGSLTTVADIRVLQMPSALFFKS
jgi:hypothetical protein